MAVHGGGSGERTTRADAASRWWAAAVGAWLVAVAGPVARHVDDGFAGRAAVAAAIGAVLVVVRVLAPRSWRAVVALLATIGLALALTTDGARRGTAVVLLSGVVTAAALVEWQPTKAWPRRRVAVVWPAVALVAVAGLHWFQRRPLVLVVLTLLAALAVVELHHRRPEACARAARRASRGAGAVAGALVAVVVGVVAFPLLYLPGAVGRIARRAVRGPALPSTWSAPVHPVAEQRAMSRAPFLPVARPVRRRRHVVGLLVVVALVAGIVRVRSDHGVTQVASGPGVADAPVATSPTPGAPDLSSLIVEQPFSSLPAFEGVAYADELQAQLRSANAGLQEAEAGGLIAADHVSSMVNVTDGARSTQPSTCTGCPEVTVWLTGGSVAFGLGQRDVGTIASELVRLAAADGIALRVLNLAVPGRTLWQEVEGIEARRMLGQDAAPDLLVSIGGYNDILGTLIAGAVRGNDPTQPSVMDVDDVVTYLAEEKTVDDAGGVDVVADLAVSRFLAAKALYQEQAQQLGAAAYLYVHPDALASPVQAAPVEGIYPSIGPDEQVLIGELLERASTALAPAVGNLRHLYDELDTSVFVDWAHTNERGAALLAAAVYADLRAALLEAR